MTTIWKYTLEENLPWQTLRIPQNMSFLSVQMQNSKITLWFLVCDDLPTKEYRFFVAGTGHDITNDVKGKTLTHLGTVQHGPWVWHVFVDRTNSK